MRMDGWSHQIIRIINNKIIGLKVINIDKVQCN